MLTPGNVVKVYKKEVLDNLVSGWNKVGFLSCKIYMEKELGRMKKELTTYDRGKCRKLFFQ
ncbi:unknown [Coprococcus comes CAG:19]|nr:unknown [Coprococcus comes CAG:19]